MITTQEYVNMLGMSDEDLRRHIEKMSEEDAKEFLFRMILFSNNERKISVEQTLGISV